MLLRYTLFITLLISNIAYCQIGGQHAFQFLDLDFNARSSALGGDYIGIKDDDINLAIANPASISDKLGQKVGLNHSFFPSGINFGQVVIGHNVNSLGMVVGHLRYVSYGSFDRTNVTGQTIGSFTAGDYALGVGFGKTLNERISIGANLNLIFSHYESYVAAGVSADISAMYHNEDKNLTATILTRNIGVQLKSFTSNNKEPLPLEVLAGISYKLQHAPFRFSLMGHDLMNWDLSYTIPGAQPIIDQLTQDTIPVPITSFVEKTFRHLNIGFEIIPSDHFSLRLGYNFDRRKTYGIIDRIGIHGFSGGIGFRVKQLDFNYSVAFYSAAGASNMISVTSNFSEWRKKKS